MVRQGLLLQVIGHRQGYSMCRSSSLPTTRPYWNESGLGDIHVSGICEVFFNIHLLTQYDLRVGLQQLDRGHRAKYLIESNVLLRIDPHTRTCKEQCYLSLVTSSTQNYSGANVERSQMYQPQSSSCSLSLSSLSLSLLTLSPVPSLCSLSLLSRLSVLRAPSLTPPLLSVSLSSTLTNARASGRARCENCWGGGTRRDRGTPRRRARAHARQCERLRCMRQRKR